jgi:hypothetical protein
MMMQACMHVLQDQRSTNLASPRGNRHQQQCTESEVPARSKRTIIERLHGAAAAMLAVLAGAALGRLAVAASFHGASHISGLAAAAAVGHAPDLLFTESSIRLGGSVQSSMASGCDSSLISLADAAMPVCGVGCLSHLPLLCHCAAGALHPHTALLSAVLLKMILVQSGWQPGWLASCPMLLRAKN